MPMTGWTMQRAFVQVLSLQLRGLVVDLDHDPCAVRGAMSLPVELLGHRRQQSIAGQVPGCPVDDGDRRFGWWRPENPEWNRDDDG